MWHYQSYNKPITWENYYSQRHATITSGIAAATTIVIFFVILLLTFGCRFFSNRRRRRSGRSSDGTGSVGASQQSLDDQRMFVICNCSIPPPLPTYEDALKMVPRPLDIERGEKEALPPPPKYSLTSGETIYTITAVSTSTTSIAQTITTTTGEQQGEESHQQEENLPSTTTS
ncbi:unnamed protein product [Meloidogyne enterolobii]|uniref:Uncharacterized protein n=1 Tax=Meloidogyne enterolobii TaxID=390850 RepID=A0ACB1B1I3_MELEN